MQRRADRLPFRVGQKESPMLLEAPDQDAP